MMSRRTLARLVLLCLGLLAAFALRDLGWSALFLGPAFAWGCGTLGLHAYQTHVLPERLAGIRSAWEGGAEPFLLLAALDGLEVGKGELAARVFDLKAQVLFSEGKRNEAWGAGWEAQGCRLSPLSRFRLVRILATAPNDPALGRKAEALLRHAPGLARMHQMVGLLQLREAPSPTAWSHLRTALVQGAEDVMLVEDILMVALSRLREPRAPLSAADPDPVWDTFQDALDLLLHRHGHPRLPWDRVSPAQLALQEGLHETVLALAHSLPPRLRPPQLWAMEIRALRELGDPEGALEASTEALEIHPRGFDIWMERHHCALHLQRHDEGLRTLTEAHACLDQALDAPDALAFWRLRRAEFAYWVEGQPEQAMALLDKVPEPHRGPALPPLATELKVALGRYEEAYGEVEALLQAHPDDLALLLLQADCMAGMGAWEALPEFLEALAPEAREKADYWHLLGLAYSHLARKLPSREALERAALLDPGNLRILLDAGHACMDLAEWDRAAHHWRQALRLEPENEEALIELAETRRLAHDREGARRILRECLLHHPESERAQQYLAELEAQ